MIEKNQNSRLKNSQNLNDTKNTRMVKVINSKSHFFPTSFTQLGESPPQFSHVGRSKKKKKKKKTIQQKRNRAQAQKKNTSESGFSTVRDPLGGGGVGSSTGSESRGCATN